MYKLFLPPLLEKDQDFELIEELLREAYTNQISIDPKQHPLCMSDPNIHDSKDRQRLTELVFEKFDIGNFFLCKGGVLSCFASGRATALILDSGATSTFALPVNDGYALRKPMVNYNIGGEYISRKLMNIIEQKKEKAAYPYQFYNKTETEQQSLDALYLIKDCSKINKSFDLFSRLRVAREMKEEVCKVCEIRTEMQLFANLVVYNIRLNADDYTYELPDKQTIKLKEERILLCEGFFDGEIMKKDQPEIIGFKGMHHVVMDSIHSCTIDLKKELLQNIIVTGGNSLLRGFLERMQNQLFDIAPQNAKMKVLPYPYPNSVERSFSSWIGGSILSCLGTFQCLWIPKQEYEEQGSIIIEKKCA